MKRALAGGAVFAATFLVPACSFMNHQVHPDCTVINKDSLQKVTGDKNGTHTTFDRRLITTCGTFIVEDSVVGGFNSYDTWNTLAIGKVYDIETGGYRVGVFGSFPTVTKVTAK